MIMTRQPKTLIQAEPLGIWLRTGLTLRHFQYSCHYDSRNSWCLLATGEIDSFKIGKRRKVPRDALDGYIERLRAEQAAATGSLAELRLPKQ
jgi:hypothetical protein